MTGDYAPRDGARHPRARTLVGRPGRDALARGPLRARTRSWPRRPTRRSPTLHDRGSPSHDGWPRGSRRSSPRDGGADRRAAADALGAAAGRRATRSARSRCCARSRVADGRWLAGRRADWVATWAGPLGARRRRRGRGRRGPGARARARARGGVVGRARAADRRGARLPAQPDGDARRPGLAARRSRGHARPRARRARVVAGRPGRVAGRGATRPARHGAAAGAGR